MLSPTTISWLNEVGPFGLKRLYWIQYIFYTLVYIVVEICIAVQDLQTEWHYVATYGLVCTVAAVGDVTPMTFFRPISPEWTELEKKNWWYAYSMITSTSFISWIMAKSVYNSSILGGKYGIVGPIAYSCWFLGVATTGIVVYFLRKQGYYSLPQFINDRYGRLSCIVYCLLLAYRLFNEVWSNTIVIADFFGKHNPGMSDEWEAAAWLCMVVPAVYSLVGGMNASLMSDAIQTVLAFILLFVTYAAIDNNIKGNDKLQQYLKDNNQDDSLFSYNPDPSREMWSLAGGVDLVLTGILQGCLSYTFMDPALTDRAFLASPRVMLPAYLSGSVLAFIFIMLFGCIGVYGNMLGSCIGDGTCSTDDLNGADEASLTKGYPAAVGKSMGQAYYSILCLIMITSAMSTLDSTFSGIAKLFGPDLNGFIVEGHPVDPKDAQWFHVHIGRIAIVLFAIAGTLPIYGDASTLSATTVTGTMAPGLGPPIYMAAVVAALAMVPHPRFEAFKSLCGKNFRTRPAMFLLPFMFSAALGVVYQITAQTDNCYASKVLACGAPVFSSTASDMCSNYDEYFSCIYASGCWSESYHSDCIAVKESSSCTADGMQCYGGASRNYYFTDAETKTQYSSFVDLSGFNIGTGSYGKLLGVNCISALGALCFFLFAASDDFLALVFPEQEGITEGAAAAVDEKDNELIDPEIESRL